MRRVDPPLMYEPVGKLRGCLTALKQGVGATDHPPPRQDEKASNYPLESVWVSILSRVARKRWTRCST